jgi:hypothetical protein
MEEIYYRNITNNVKVRLIKNNYNSFYGKNIIEYERLTDGNIYFKPEYVFKKTYKLIEL